MKNTIRGQRLEHVKRLKLKRKNYHGFGLSYGQEGIRVMNPLQLGKVAQYPCICSCFMCSYNKKYYGNSFSQLKSKEKSFILLFKAEFKNEKL